MIIFVIIIAEIVEKIMRLSQRQKLQHRVIINW